MRSKVPNSPLVLAGDFNYPGINWAACTVSDDCAKKNECRKSLEMADYFIMRQMVTTPTREDAVLDLIFTSHREHASVRVIDKISHNCAIHRGFALIVNKRELTRNYCIFITR